MYSLFIHFVHIIHSMVMCINACVSVGLRETVERNSSSTVEKGLAPINTVYKFTLIFRS